jgi:hypothetical protein
MKPQITERVLYDTSVMVRRVAMVLRDMGLAYDDEAIAGDGNVARHPASEPTIIERPVPQDDVQL